MKQLKLTKTELEAIGFENGKGCHTSYWRIGAFEYYHYTDTWK